MPSQEKQAKKILIADDDDRFSAMIKSALEQAGFDITQAIDGEEAVAQAKAVHPNLILLDIMMPKKLGFEVLEELKAGADTKNIPIITISHLAQPSDTEKAKQLGAVEHLIKTDFSIRGLIDKIREYVE